MTVNASTFSRESPRTSRAITRLVDPNASQITPIIPLVSTMESPKFQRRLERRPWQVLLGVLCGPYTLTYQDTRDFRGP